MKKPDIVNENLSPEEKISEAIRKVSAFFALFEIDGEPDAQGQILVDQTDLFKDDANAMAQCFLALKVIDNEFPQRATLKTVNDARIAFKQQHTTGLNNLETITEHGLTADPERKFSITGISSALGELHDKLVTKAQTRERIKQTGINL